MAERVVEVTAPNGTVMDSEISPVRVLRAVFAKCTGRTEHDEISKSVRQVGALPGDAIEIDYIVTIDDVTIAVSEARGFIQDTFAFAISATDDKLDFVETVLLQAASEAGLVHVRRK